VKIELAVLCRIRNGVAGPVRPASRAGSRGGNQVEPGTRGCQRFTEYWSRQVLFHLAVTGGGDAGRASNVSAPGQAEYGQREAKNKGRPEDSRDRTGSPPTRGFTFDGVTGHARGNQSRLLINTRGRGPGIGRRDETTARRKHVEEPQIE
jgi:hypothetical protein